MGLAWHWWTGNRREFSGGRALVRARPGLTTLGPGLMLAQVGLAMVCSAAGQAIEAPPGVPLTAENANGMSCSANPRSFEPGQTVTVTARAGEALKMPLHYSYSANRGTIHGSGATATLSTAGVAGVITVTCRVVDASDHTATATTTVYIAEPASHEPASHEPVSHIGPSGAPPPPPEHVLHEKMVAPPHPAEETLPAPAPAPAPAEAAPPPPHGQPSPLQPVAPTPANPYSLGDQVEAWKQTLKNGAIEPVVPPTMIAGTASPVEVKIHGYQDTQTHTPGAVGSAPLKVSQDMKVMLLPGGSPGEFTITPLGNPEVQFVPNEGAATWRWSVTPTDSGKAQKLLISVYLEYGGGTEDDVYDNSYMVNVNVQPLGTTIKNDYVQNTNAWFKYLLPGGAGFAALAAVVAWLWKRRKKSGDGKDAGKE